METIQKAIAAIANAVQKRLTPRKIDNRYSANQVQEVIESLSLDLTCQELMGLLVHADRQGLECLVNAAVHLLVYSDQSAIQGIVEKQLTNQIPLHMHVYLKKHLTLKSLGIVQEYTVADALEGNCDFIDSVSPTGSVSVEPYIDMSEAIALDGTFTSLYGLHLLHTLAKEASSKKVNFRFVSFVLDSSNDPDFKKDPFSSLHNVKSLSLNFSNQIDLAIFADFKYENIKNLGSVDFLS